MYRGYIEAVTKEHRSSNKETTKQIGYEDGENEEIRLGTGDSQNAEPMFTERANAYQDFASLANGLPPVYVEKIQMTDASFLMPGIPVSNGKLPPVEQHLGTVDGKPALLTDLGVGNRQWGEQLWLYTAEQRGEDVIPRVHCTLYQQYMTDEALQRAAKSYGGITDKPFLSPR